MNAQLRFCLSPLNSTNLLKGNLSYQTLLLDTNNFPLYLGLRSLLGFLQCTFMMFLINWFVALSAWLLAAVLYKYIQYNILWADRYR